MTRYFLFLKQKDFNAQVRVLFWDMYFLKLVVQWRGREWIQFLMNFINPLILRKSKILLYWEFINIDIFPFGFHWFSDIGISAAHCLVAFTSLHIVRWKKTAHSCPHSYMLPHSCVLYNELLMYFVQWATFQQELSSNNKWGTLILAFCFDWHAWSTTQVLLAAALTPKNDSARTW